MNRSFLCTSIFTLTAFLVAAPALLADATITIVNNDGAGEGFNDPTPVSPVGGNPGVTLGAQRLNAFERAAEIWGEILQSSVPILVNSQFNALTCSGTSAVLGSAGTIQVFRDFTGAPLAGTWYHSALANALEGSDLDPGSSDITAQFNSSIDTGCLTGVVGWYYGFVPGAASNQIPLLPVVLHEIGHGLGFANFINETNGQLLGGFPDIYSVYTFDNTLGRSWADPVTTNAERIASAINSFNVVWTDGVSTTSVTTAAATYLGPKPVMQINSPAGIAGTYLAQNAAFGPPLTLGGTTGNVVLADDGTGTTTDACEALVNGGSILGNICLVDRGSCAFVTKVTNCQTAGAIGVVVANNVASGLPGMGGSDPSILIPSIGITQSDGALIKANIPAPGVNLTMLLDAGQLAGADTSGDVMLYAPNPVALGSSISHFDTMTSPNTLMEPAINADLFDDVDLTAPLMSDVGWTVDLIFTDSFEKGDTSHWSSAVP